MSLFCKQQVYCMACGGKFMTDFNLGGGYGNPRVCCCKSCYEELQLKQAYAICGKPFEPKPAAKPDLPNEKTTA